MSNYQQAVAFVESLTDQLGRPIDQGIKKPLIAFYLLDIKTTGSCQGHQDRGLSYPWIDTNNSYSEVAFLENELPLFHFVKKDSGNKSSLRLVPKRVLNISDHQQGDFSQELKEINNWAEIKIAKLSS